MYLLDAAARHRTSGMMYRQLVLYGRHLDRKFEIFLWPAIDALLFGAIGTYAARKGGANTLVTMLAGFLMAQVVWQAHIHLSKFFLQETWDRNVLYLMTRPLRNKEVFTAAIGLTTLVTLGAMTFIVLAIALTFSLDLARIPAGIVLLIPILLVLGWTTGLFATSVVMRMGQKADNLVWALFGIIGPLSGSIVPVDNLPSVLATIAKVMPTTHAYEAGRALLFGTGTPWQELAIAAGGTLLVYGAALYFLARSIRVFRQRGYISRYM